MSVLSPPLAATTPRLSVADQVFECLKAEIVSLHLTPGTRLSEADVASRMDVSRQPVRDAFYRLSKLGFLTIRPQRATTVSAISAAAVLRARFIRATLEVETVRQAATSLSDADLGSLTSVVAAQRSAIDAGDHDTFHQLDDELHRQIAVRSGLGFSWDVICESKAHMDRVRYLTLSTTSEAAYSEHVALLAALGARDAEAAAAAMRDHLSRIADQIAALRQQHHSWFASDDEAAGPRAGL